MAWNAQDMNPNLKVDDLLKTGPLGKEKVITQFILPAMRNACPLMPKKMASETTMRGFAERALDQGFLPDAIISAVNSLPDRYEAWPSWLEFHATLRSFAPAKILAVNDGVNIWLEKLVDMTNALILEHGREKIEALANQYSEGVYGWHLDRFGEFRENIIRLFINDKMMMGKNCSMEQVIKYANSKMAPVRDPLPKEKAPEKNINPTTFVDRTASIDKF